MQTGITFIKRIDDDKQRFVFRNVFHLDSLIKLMMDTQIVCQTVVTEAFTTTTTTTTTTKTATNNNNNKNSNKQQQQQLLHIYQSPICQICSNSETYVLGGIKSCKSVFDTISNLLRQRRKQ